MIPKSMQRFSEKTTLKQEGRVGWRFRKKPSHSSYRACGPAAQPAGVHRPQHLRASGAQSDPAL